MHKLQLNSKRQNAEPLLRKRSEKLRISTAISSVTKLGVKNLVPKRCGNYHE